MGNKLKEKQRERLRDKIVNGAVQYKNKLMNKEFLVIVEDGCEYTVRFFEKDFVHLTGMSSDLSDERFFENSLMGTLSDGNILEDQKYNWSTLKGKTDRIEKIDQIIYGKTENSLFMINLHTNTGDYPVAIRNKDFETCVGFRDKIHRARTLRKYANSADADMEKEIIAIVSRKAGESVYDEIVYLKDAKLLTEKAQDIVTRISSLDMSCTTE